MNYWLLKSEPDVFSIDDLKRIKIDHWDGVRNYQARNMLRDQIKKGDLAFFYHSNCDEPGIAGIVTIIKDGYPDHKAFDPESEYYDPKSSPENPRWFMVDVYFKRRLKRKITLAELKTEKELDTFPLIRKGNRLSVLPVSKSEWEHILKMEHKT